MDEVQEDAMTVLKACAIAVVLIVLVLLGLAATDSSAAPVQHGPQVSLDPSMLPAAITQATTPTTVPTTQPAPVVPSAAMNGEVDGAYRPAPAPAGCYADLASQVGWPAEAIPHLTAIIERESHCDPASDTGYRPSTGDWSLGLLQINTLGDLLGAREQVCGITAREQLLDPATNLRCGLALYQASGFAPWGG